MTQLEELTARIGRWTQDELSADIVPDLIDLVQGDMNRRLRVRQNTVRTQVLLVPNSVLSPLPHDFLGAKHIALDGVDMDYMTLEQMNNSPYMCAGQHGYAIVGNKIRVHPQIEQSEQTIVTDPAINIASQLRAAGDGKYNKDELVISWSSTDEVTRSYTVTVVRYENANPDAVANYLYQDQTSPMSLAVDWSLYNYSYLVVDANDTNARSDTLHSSVVNLVKSTTNEGGGSTSIETFTMPPLDVTYYHKQTALQESVGGLESWLYRDFPDLYLYGCLAEAFKFLYDAPRADSWKMRYDEAIAELINKDQGDVFSGGTLRVSAV